MSIPDGGSRGKLAFASVSGEFAGKIVVVTGAGSGIGRSSAQLFGRLGAKVHVADINGESAEQVAAQIGPSAVAHTVDCTDPEAVDALAQRVFDEDGRVDVLHNNAGIGHAADIEHTTIEDWQKVIGLNLLGAAYVVQAFVPRMLRAGGRPSIVNTASMAGLVAAPQMAPYSASKFGVVGMSEALGAELAPRGIHVCALCPGIIDTPITRSAILRGEPAERREQAIAFYRKRGASPDRVAEAAVEAVRKRKLIQPVPSLHVTPAWLLKRLSPRASQLVARTLPKLVMRGK
jgi:NAD(P)-dependent dehydrogenase (short-subunit alcohol dehydrogenase family)